MGWAMKDGRDDSNGAEQITKYERWIGELEARQRTLAASRSSYLRFFLGSLVASMFGYFWNVWFGAATVLTGVLFCGFGFYVVLVRLAEYRSELATLRETVRQFRAQRSEDA